MKAASLADYLPFAAIVDQGVALCKDGSLLHAWRVLPKDLTYVDESYSSMYVRNMADIFRTLSESPYIIYADCQMKENRKMQRHCSEDAPETAKAFNRRRGDLLPHYASDMHVALLLKPPSGKGSLERLVFGNGKKMSDSEILSKQLAEFKRSIVDVGNMLRGTYLEAEALSNDGLATYLHSTFSDSDHHVQAPSAGFFYLDSYLADGTVYPDVITRYNNSYVCTISIHLWPSETAAGFISRLASYPMEFRAVSSFEFIGREKAKQRIKADRKTHFKKRKGVGQMAADTATRTESTLEDTDALALASDASVALSQVSDGYTSFGYLTFTLVLMRKDYRALQEDCETLKSFVQGEGYICKAETINNPLAWLGSVPGNYGFNAKKYYISTRNLAHFFPLSSPWEGAPYDSHLRDLYKEKYDMDIEAPFINAQSYGKRRFNLNLSYKGCGHTLLVGPTGMGKSVLLCMMSLAALKYPYSQVISFDKGASCRNACLKSGGAFFEFDDTPESLKLNPFSDLSGTDRVSQISNLLISYLKAKEVGMLPADEQKVYEAVSSLAAMPVENRGFETFCNAVQNSDIRLAFQPFVDGEHAYLFKAGKDEIQQKRWIAFEMEWLMANKPAEMVEFVLNYLFIAISRFLDGNFKFITLDEAWVYVRNKAFCDIIDDMLRTWRKKNAYAVLTTQNANDAFNSPIYATILNACYTKILTPNPRASKTENADFYKSLDMSANDLYVLESIAAPNKDYLFINPEGKQLFDLRLSSEELDIIKKPPTEGGRA